VIKKSTGYLRLALKTQTNTPSQAHLQGTQSRCAKANLAKELQLTHSANSLLIRQTIKVVISTFKNNEFYKF
jgi:hypothetical protein